MSLTPLNIPQKKIMPSHIAIIMDGNGRWANHHSLPRLEGHKKGASVVRDITTFTSELGIPFLTLYTFSVQNWQRPIDEVSGLLKLLEEYCIKERNTLMDNNIRLSYLGDISKIPISTQKILKELCDVTSKNTAMMLTLAINYGGREEIIHATKKIAESIKSGEIDVQDINEKYFQTHYFSPDIPDPDLIIRTSGELRLSNFLLWQLAYTELYFTDVFWPDFKRDHFCEALNEFSRRKRRFGYTQDQVHVLNNSFSFKNNTNKTKTIFPYSP